MYTAALRCDDQKLHSLLVFYIILYLIYILYVGGSSMGRSYEATVVYMRSMTS